MDGYDPSATGILKEKLRRGLEWALQMLPIRNPLSEPLDPAGVLTVRELEILRLYGTNRTPKEIAIRLFISIQSANSTLSLIARKLRIRRRDLHRVAVEYVRSTGWSPL